MSDLSDIREGIKTVIESRIKGLTVHPYPPANSTPPSLVIGEVETDGSYETVGDNTFRVNLEMTLKVHSGNVAEGWQELDAYKSPSGDKSIRAAIRTDPTLNGKADGAEVDWASDSQAGGEGRANLYSCVFPIEVLKTVA